MSPINAITPAGPGGDVTPPEVVVLPGGPPARGDRMKIFIAASWRSATYAWFLAEVLEARAPGVSVHAFSRDATPLAMAMGRAGEPAWWLDDKRAAEVCRRNIELILEADLVIYLGPAGCDSWAEVGAAHAAGATVWGLRAEGEAVGVCRHLVDQWFTSADEMVRALAQCVGPAREARS